MGGTVVHSKAGENTVYLSFDDGPHPDSTPELLKLLNIFNAKASFFCSGQKAEAFPELFNQIVECGHAVGNHGYMHLNGFKTGTVDYFTDITKASENIKSKLLRPPYGKITPAQIRFLKRTYNIIYWDLLFTDYRQNFDPVIAFAKAKKHLRPGKIIVMHDSPTNYAKTKILITLILEYLNENGIIPSKLIHERL